MFKIPFIFLTSRADIKTLERAKATHPYGFVVKPFQESDVNAAVVVVLSNFKKQNQVERGNEDNGYILNDCLFVKNNGILEKLKLDDITHLQADVNYTQVFTIKKRIVLRGTLKDLEAKLIQPQFVRIRKSHIINVNTIEAIHPMKFILQKFPISRSHTVGL